MRKLSVVDRTLVRWVLGMVLALAIALGSLALINRLVYGPTGEVRAYFQALSAGDGSRALGISQAKIPQGTGATLLDGGALASSMKKLEDLKLTTESMDDHQAVVRASYVIEGQAHSTDFKLHKAGSHWGVFDVWDFDPVTLPVVRMTAPGVSGATVNNVKVSVPQVSRDFAVFYPGIYTSTYESAFFSSQEQRAEVLSQEGEHKLSLNLAPSQAAITSITNSVKKDLDSCATQNALYPTACPFSFTFLGRVNDAVTWTIKEYPKTDVRVTKDGNWEYKKAKGIATVSFTELDLYTGKTSPVQKDVPFTYDASLSLTDKAVTVTPRN